MGRPVNAHAQACPIVAAIRQIGSVWSLTVIRYLMDHPRSFNDLMRVIGRGSSRSLSRTLKRLQQLGLVTREVVSTQPFSVRYQLTEKGRDLRQILERMRLWGERWAIVAGKDKKA